MQLANCSELRGTASLLPPNKTKSLTQTHSHLFKKPMVVSHTKAGEAGFSFICSHCKAAWSRGKHNSQHGPAGLRLLWWAAASSEMVSRNQAAAGLRILGFMVYYACLDFSTRHVGQIIHCAIGLSSKPREFIEAARLLSQAEFNLLSC